MNRLKNDWITDGLIDFEYKKYILLAYLKNVQQEFNKVELYPSLADLVMHYENLNALKKGQEDIESKFPKQLDGMDLNQFSLIYKKLSEDNEVLKELSSIVEYALPKLKRSLEEGKEIYEFVEEQCEFSPVGLLPLYVDEGYLLISNSTTTETDVYRYHLNIIQSANETYRGIHTSFIKRINRRIGETVESIKLQLAKKFKDLPNPATFSVDARMKFPFTPTLVPVAKRLLVRYVSTA